MMTTSLFTSELNRSILHFWQCLDPSRATNFSLTAERCGTSTRKCLWSYTPNTLQISTVLENFYFLGKLKDSPVHLGFTGNSARFSVKPGSAKAMMMRKPWVFPIQGSHWMETVIIPWTTPYPPHGFIQFGQVTTKQGAMKTQKAIKILSSSQRGLFVPVEDLSYAGLRDRMSEEEIQ